LSLFESVWFCFWITVWVCFPTTSSKLRSESTSQQSSNTERPHALFYFMKGFSPKEVGLPIQTSGTKDAWSKSIQRS
jgi:hypothetical protein